MHTGWLCTVTCVEINKYTYQSIRDNQRINIYKNACVMRIIHGKKRCKNSFRFKRKLMEEGNLSRYG